ncbi:GNAT family N-acetyltransferase [Sphingomonas fennica]|uniref:N-acetyltransferase n=1 Tax=Edaphosphingomonas fennica TaxID=114404 RepID=A0A2T4HUF0_9SPHN|nr:GNAT family N-acetyltransferase [Sphingomonas fennica]PTD19397.1 N-acetyltransferase [Sphingomonas fennica]
METLHPRLRPWREGDLPAFRLIQTDPDIVHWLAGPWTDEQVEAAFARMLGGLRERGWGMWAIVDDEGVPVGAAGLQPVREDLACAPAIEVAWRLRRAHWGRGYVTGPMRAVLADAAERLQGEEIIAITSVPNIRSQAVMDRLGFRRDPAADFDHPALDAAHPLRRHVLYRLKRF